MKKLGRESKLKAKAGFKFEMDGLLRPEAVIRIGKGKKTALPSIFIKYSR